MSTRESRIFNVERPAIPAKAARIAAMCNSDDVPGLDVETQSLADVTILVLRGELDIDTRFMLRDVAMEQLAVPGVTKLQIDLGDVTFLDSSGVSALVDLRKEANGRGVELTIPAVSRPAARILSIVGLAETFGVRPEAAMRQRHPGDAGS